jgi:hypothetical protein
MACGFKLCSQVIQKKRIQACANLRIF